MRRNLLLIMLLIGGLLFSQEYLYRNIDNGISIPFSDAYPLKIYRIEPYVTTRGFGIISLALPETWSELEKEYIENDISIIYTYTPGIKSIEALEAAELRRTSDIMVERRNIIREDDTIKYEMITKINNIYYYSFSKLIFINETNYGYIISFTATKGTYDINLKYYINLLNIVALENPRSMYVDNNSRTIVEQSIQICRLNSINVNNSLLIPVDEKIYGFMFGDKDLDIFVRTITREGILSAVILMPVEAREILVRYCFIYDGAKVAKIYKYRTDTDIIEESHDLKVDISENTAPIILTPVKIATDADVSLRAFHFAE